MDATEQKVKVVIELSEKDYIALRDYHAKIGEDLFNLERNMAIAIRNGIPLPKGHGDLVDRNKLSPIYRQMSYCSTAPNFIWVNELMKVEPVIKADKESE